MGAAYFYHLTRRSLPETLRMLLEKSLQNNWRVVVRGTSQEGIEALDKSLWLQPDDGFLPHGLAGEDHEADQPVLLTTQDPLPNNPHCLMSVDGAEVAASEVSALDRVCVIFDGNDDAALSRARAQWKILTAEGVSAQYWSEESGRWEMKAESG